MWESSVWASSNGQVVEKFSIQSFRSKLNQYHIDYKLSTPFPKFRAGTGYANHEFSIDQNFQFALFELIESPPTSVESEPKDTDIIQAIPQEDTKIIESEP